MAAYIKRVTLCFVPPLMKTTTWLSKRLAIINQFWLVKSSNRLKIQSNVWSKTHKFVAPLLEIQAHRRSLTVWFVAGFSTASFPIFILMV